MKQSKTPAFTASVASPSKQQSPPLVNNAHHHGSTKASDISHGITLVDVALESLRQQRNKKESAKKSDHSRCRDMDPAVTQALMVSRMHLVDYRKQVGREVRAKHGIIQDSSISPKKLMEGLHPFWTSGGEHLPEPTEAIDKLRALVSLLLNSQDEKTNEFMVNVNDIAWAILLLSDLVDEVEKRANRYQDHYENIFEEFKKRLEFYYLVPRDLGTRKPMGAVREVQQ